LRSPSPPALLALALALLLALVLPRAAEAQVGSAFAYSAPCAPASGNQNPAAAYTIGNTAYLCITLNGRVVSMFNVIVDKFTALALSGCA